MKRLFDAVAAAAGIIVLSPVLLLAAVAVKLDSPGPVFFRQERVGRGGAPFRIFKFRTMRADAENNGPHITAGDDVRITKAGAVLRRTKIDELPQLFNVLAGDMSLVGPRPELQKFVDLWPPEVKEVLLSVRPGMTDPASIRFSNEGEILAGQADPEAAYVKMILPEKLRLATDYARTATLLSDCRIILRTAAALFRR